MSSQRYERVRVLFHLISDLQEKPATSMQIIEPSCPIDPNFFGFQVNAHDEDDHRSSSITPSSPPPSFRSRASSPTSRHHHSSSISSAHEDPNQTLADAFDDGAPSDDEDEGDDRQRLMRGNPSPSAPSSGSPRSSDASSQRPATVQRRVTDFPGVAAPSTRTARPVGSMSANDGVFANLAAKPERGEKLEEQPPVRLHPFINSLYTSNPRRLIILY